MQRGCLLGFTELSKQDFEEIQLYRGAQIAFVPKHHAVVVFPFHILEIMEVVNVGSRHIEGMYHAAYPADCVEFIPIVVHALRGAIAPRWRTLKVIAPHDATLGAGILTHLDWLGVNAEHILPAVHGSSDVFADILTEFACQLTALVILAARDKARQEIAFLRFEPLEQQVLAVDAEGLGRGRQGDDFQVGELGDDTSTRYICIISAALGHLRASSHGSHLHEISEFVNTIPGEFLVDVEYFYEVCDEVVHERGYSS